MAAAESEPGDPGGPRTRHTADLLRGEDLLCPLEIADSYWARLRGLLGRDSVDGALLLRPSSSVHTVGMRCPLDVAFLDRDLVVVDLVTMRRHRLGRPRRRARSVLEAAEGAFARWQLAVGDQLAVRMRPEADTGRPR